MNIIQVNKRLSYDYEIIESYEAGIVLSGQEVKSIKSGNISLKGAYISVRDGELYLVNANIAPYRYAHNLSDYSPLRPRKLLLKKKEIIRIITKIQEKGLTLLPFKVYTKKNLVKLEIVVVRGKRKIDKREAIKKRETDREIRRRLKTRG